MSATDPLDAALRRLHLPAVRQHYPELAAQAVAENWSYPSTWSASPRPSWSAARSGASPRPPGAPVFPF